MKKVFEYMGWENRLPHKTVYDSLNEPHPLDGNDMVLVIQKMNENNEFYGLDSFLDFADQKWDKLSRLDKMYGTNFELWLFGNPDNFFKLMEEWLNERN